MLISEEYRALNAELHARGAYGISGYKWARQVYDLARKLGDGVVLDYGCGQGTLGRALRDQYEQHSFPGQNVGLPFTFREYDPAIEGKNRRPEPADLVVCGDVLEHIEPGYLDAVLDDLRGLALKAVFLVIATQPAKKVLADGRNAHLIVQPASWWIPKLLDRWKLKSFADLGNEFFMVGAAQ